MHSYKNNYSVDVKPVGNGFLIEESWQEKKEGSEFSEYQCAKTVFLTWKETRDYLNEKFN